MIPQIAGPPTFLLPEQELRLIPLRRRIRSKRMGIDTAVLGHWARAAYPKNIETNLVLSLAFQR